MRYSPVRVLAALGRRLSRYINDEKERRHYREVPYRAFTLDILPTGFREVSLEARLQSWLDHSRFGEYLSSHLDDLHNDQQARAMLLQEAEAIVSGSLRVFCSNVRFSGTVEWNRDITRGGLWPRKFFLKLRPAILGKVRGYGDYRYVWELNRHQHLPRLALAYRLECDQRYASTVVDHIVSWIDQNPPFHSLNWYSTMELGLRLHSWCVALALVADYQEFDADDLAKIRVSIFQQASFMLENLSADLVEEDGNTKLKNNHTIVELASLLSVFGALPELADSVLPGYRDVLSRKLLDELERQTWADGMHVEQSSSYLRFVLESLLVARLSADILEINAMIARYLQALQVFRYSDSKIFLVGDEDNGHAICLHPEVFPDDIASVLAMQHLIAEPPAIQAPGTAVVLPDSGHWSYTFTVDGSAVVVYFRAGRQDFPDIPGYAPHAHCDLLSFCVAVDGELLLVDRGTGSYNDRRLAAELRGETAHNTMRVSGTRQMRLLGAFKSADHVSCRMQLCGRTSVRGMMSMPTGVDTVTVTRELFVDDDDGRIVIQDHVQGLAGQAVELFLNVAPSINVINAAVLVMKSGVTARLKGFHVEDQRKVVYSPSYGVVKRATQLVHCGTPAAAEWICRWSIDMWVPDGSGS